MIITYDDYLDKLNLKCDTIYTECFKESHFQYICCVNVNLGPGESVPWDIKGIHVLNETFEVNYSIPLHHSASLQSVEDEAKVHKEGPPSRKFQLGMFLFILVKKTSTRYQEKHVTFFKRP